MECALRPTRYQIAGQSGLGGAEIEFPSRPAIERVVNSRLIRLGVCSAGLSLPLLFGACSEDSEPNNGTGGTAGSAGSGDSGSAGSAGDVAAGGSPNGGSAGDSGGGGDFGAAGSAGGGEAGSAGSAGSPPDAGDRDAATAAFSVSSPAFDSDEGCAPDNADPCAFFPNENTQLGGGASISPEINWVGAPAGTASFAIALHDLTFAPGDEPFTHWVMWNIPASAAGLPAALPGGAEPGVPAANTEQVNYMDTGGFLGSGGCGNVYEFVLYALSTPTFDPGSTDSDAVQQALADSDDVLGTATMRARSDGAGPGC